MADPSEPKSDGLSQAISELTSKIDDIRRRLDERGLDGWGKLRIISGIVSGIVIAGLGIYATSSYNATQTRISRVAVVEKLLPYLSGDSPSRMAALESISAVGDEGLLLSLAESFTGDTGTLALAVLARSRDDDLADRARHMLATRFDHLRLTVVSVLSAPRSSKQGTACFAYMPTTTFFLTARSALGDPPYYVVLPPHDAPEAAQLQARLFPSKKIGGDAGPLPENLFGLQMLKTEDLVPNSYYNVTKPVSSSDPPQVAKGEICVALARDSEGHLVGWPSKITSVRSISDVNQSVLQQHFVIDIPFQSQLAGALVSTLAGKPFGVVEGPDARGDNTRVQSLHVMRYYDYH